MITTTDKLIQIIAQDGCEALRANQKASTLSQIEEMAGVKFASVTDLYVYLKDERVWPFNTKADSIYRAWLHGKFKGRAWIVLTPSFEDLSPKQTVRIEDGVSNVSIVVGIARAEKSLASRISKAKPRKEEIIAYLQGYKNYMPDAPGTPKPKTQVEVPATEEPGKPETTDIVDAEFTEVPALPAPAPSETPKPTKPEEPRPLYLETGIANTDRGALEEVLKAFLKTTNASNKKDLLAFRTEIKQALISVGLLEDK